MNNMFLAKQLKDDPEFIEYQDVIKVILDENQFYSKDQARQEIKKFLSKEVD